MAKNDQQEAYERQLAASLTRTIDWLKFAEAKNAALLTFSSAWVIASIRLLFVGKLLPWHFGTALKINIVLLGISALFAMWSILPKLKLQNFTGPAARPGTNLLYFDHIASLDCEMFKERVRARFMPPAEDSATDDYLDDLAVQVHVNSQIAARKFRLFDQGARVALLGMLVMLWPAAAMFAEWAL